MSRAPVMEEFLPILWSDLLISSVTTSKVLAGLEPTEDLLMKG